MTDTATEDRFDKVTIDAAQAELESTVEALSRLISEGTGIPKGVRVSADPAEVVIRMTADGSLGHGNDIILELDGVEARISPTDLDALMESNGSLQQLIMSRLGRIGAVNPLTDAQLIRALLAKLDGSVELTLDEVSAARKPSTIQYDGLKLTLVHG